MTKRSTKSAAKAESSKIVNMATLEEVMNLPPVTDATELVGVNPVVPAPLTEQTPAAAEEEKTTPEQFASWMKAAELGNPQAQYLCAMCLIDGDGVAQDLQQAAVWFGRAADQGHVTAMSNLAGMYNVGYGVPVDRVKAIEWLTKAADAGNPAAQLSMARACASGDGVKQDHEAAFKWGKRAANQGNAEAMELLAKFLRDGTGTAVDGVASVLWHERAERQRQRQRDKQNALPAEGLPAVAESIADKVELDMPDGDDLFVPTPEIRKDNYNKVFVTTVEEAKRVFKDPPVELRDALASGLTDLVFELKLGLPKGGDGNALSTLHTASRQMRKKLIENNASERAEAINNILGSMVASGCLYSQYFDYLINRIESQHLSPSALREHLRGKIEVEDHLLRVIEVMQVVHNLPGIQSGVKVTATGDNSSVHVQQLNLSRTAKEDSQ